jgi:hypothetical protein
MMHSSDEDIEYCSVYRFGSIELFTKKTPKIIKKFGNGSPWKNRISSIEFGSKFYLSSIVSLYRIHLELAFKFSIIKLQFNYSLKIKQINYLHEKETKRIKMIKFWSRLHY